MKTKQTKINRSGAALLPGAMAFAATTASSQAAIVQITLTGNMISNTGGDQINGDLTGDNVSDMALGGGRSNYGVFVYSNGVFEGAPIFRAYWSRFPVSMFIADPVMFTDLRALGAVGRGYGVDDPQDAWGLSAITFSDSRINGGAASGAWLEVHAFNTSTTASTIELTRLIFDDSSTTRPVFNEIPGTQSGWVPSSVPEPSSFGMLALGAGGLLARRRRAKQAA